jgi:hypothetical protein
MGLQCGSRSNIVRAPAQPSEGTVRYAFARFEMETRVLRGTRGMASCLLVAFVIVGGCNPFKRGPSPITECDDYLAALTRCFGPETGRRMKAAFPPPPKDEEARSRAKQQCSTELTRLRQTCR